MNKGPKNWFFRNLANIVTLSAFPLCFVLLWVIISHRDQTVTILILVTSVFLTDFFDGKIARNISGTSKFGGAADRLRDKLLLGIMFLFLILDGRIHLSLKIITVPLAVVETALLVYWFIGLKKKMDVSTVKSSMSRFGHGQIKMFLLSIAILLCLLNIIIEERWGLGYHLWSTFFLNSIFLVSLFYAVKSFISHRIKYSRHVSAE